MSEHSIDSLHQVLDSYEDHISYFNGNISEIDAFESGIISNENASVNFIVYSELQPSCLDSLERSLHLLDKYRLCLVENKNDNINLDVMFKNTQIKNLFKNYQKKFSMLQGISSYYRKHRKLSDRQIVWISTNWKGGYSAFTTDIIDNTVYKSVCDVDTLIKRILK